MGNRLHRPLRKFGADLDEDESEADAPTDLKLPEALDDDRWRAAMEEWLSKVDKDDSEEHIKLVRFLFSTDLIHPGCDVAM